MMSGYGVRKVFEDKNNKVVELRKNDKKKAVVNEKTIQTLIEHNLSTFFPDLEFLVTEYPIDGLRPDSIAFDNDRDSFVIIEYKNVKHGGAFDQGMSYSVLLDENKDSFKVLYQEKKGKQLNEKDVNWDESRVIVISPEFTKHQKRASQYRDLPIELYEISKYDDRILLLDRVGIRVNNKKSKSSIDSTVGERSESDYLQGKYGNPIPSEDTKQIYCKLKNSILYAFSEIEDKQMKKYVKFQSKKDGSIICTVEVAQQKLKLCYTIRKPGIVPVNSFVKDYTGKGHWGIGNYMSEITSMSDIDNAIPLIKKVYEFKILGNRSDVS